MSEVIKINYFRKGAIQPQFIAESVEKLSSDFTIGGHSIFLGQVRKDMLENKEVLAIDYSCYEEMALETLEHIIKEIKSKYQLNAIQVNHSLGKVEAGKICLFVFTASKHRRNAIDACNELVERIKKELPVWGKEIFKDNLYDWKVNT